MKTHYEVQIHTILEGWIYYDSCATLREARAQVRTMFGPGSIRIVKFVGTVVR